MKIRLFSVFPGNWKFIYVGVTERMEYGSTFRKVKETCGRQKCENLCMCPVHVRQGYPLHVLEMVSWKFLIGNG